LHNPEDSKERRAPATWLPRVLLPALLLLPVIGCAPLDSPPDSLALQQPSQPISRETRPVSPLNTPRPFLAPETALQDWQAILPGEEEEDLATLYDFPITMNEQVEYYLDFFQNRQHKTFGSWLSRSARYLPMVKKQLAEAGLPQDLAYLPLIESGYNLRAYSSAKAVGPWQFMQATGRGYGLTVNSYVDERRDPIKSTQAAVAYLANLYEEFESWHLAVAAYNAGEGRIRKAIKGEESTDFWEIASGNYLHSETREYVPKLIAAIMIAKDPEKYGFADIEYEEPLEFETVAVPRWTSLKAVAVACDTDFEEIYDLNRQLCKAVTPPNVPSYPLRVPPGKKEQLLQNLPRVREVATTEYHDHVVGKGETLTKICKKYGLRKTTLLKANNLQRERLTLGQRLRIPVATTTFKLFSESQLAREEKTQQPTTHQISHKVRSGETVSSIARRYKVSSQQIISWNKLKNSGRIKVGQNLSLHTSNGDVTRQTDQTEATVTQEIIQADKKKETRSAGKSPSPAREGQTAKENKTPTYHLVKLGDTLWSIARKYQLSPRDLKDWNQLEDDRLQPGNRLRLNLPEDIDT